MHQNYHLILYYLFILTINFEIGVIILILQMKKKNLINLFKGKIFLLTHHSQKTSQNLLAENMAFQTYYFLKNILKCIHFPFLFIQKNLIDASSDVTITGSSTSRRQLAHQFPSTPPPAPQLLEDNMTFSQNSLLHTGRCLTQKITITK